MRLARRSIYLAFLTLYIPAESLAQSAFDYGIGMVIVPGGDHKHAVVYKKPNVSSDTLVTLSEWEYTLYPHHQSVRAFLAGFEKYGDWGFPLLSISRDSSWARVSIEFPDTLIRLEGWVNLKTPGTIFHMWADFLLTRSMVQRSDTPQFYSKPTKHARLNITLFRFRQFHKYSYVLKPIRREGRWLLVELQTPFLPCGNDDAIEKETNIQPRTIRVWIQYLDERGRPLVRAPMMC